MLQESIIHQSFSARNLKPYAMDKKDVGDYHRLRDIGIDLGGQTMVKEMVNSQRLLRDSQRSAMDAFQPTITTPSVFTPVQFLQEWLPGMVDIVTAVRRIDAIVGVATVGAWEDEQIVQGVRELVNLPASYGDYDNVPLASSNVNFVIRTVVRFEQGIQIERLQEARAARVRIDLAGSDRESAALGLEIVRNQIGFYGFNNGANYTYGFLNDPNLLAYNTIPATGTGSSTTWASKDFLQIVTDLLQMMSGLRTQSGDLIDPKTVSLTLALPTSVIDYLGVVSQYGNSVMQWLNSTYPQVRVISAPELIAANSGANVAYLFADSIKDTSSDGGQVFIQAVPMKFKVLGVAQMAKGFEEDYSNATAGVMCKRPFGVYRITGC